MLNGLIRYQEKTELDFHERGIVMKNGTTNGFMNSLLRRARWIIPLTIIGLAPLMLSCYGQFPMTHAVYQMNGNAGKNLGEDRTGHKLVQSVVMWVLVIIPVYPIAMFGDAVILNLIEFWSGDAVNISSTQERDGVQVALKSAASGREVVMTVSRNGKLLTEQHMNKVSPTTFEMRDASGQLTGTMLKTSTGDIQLNDAQGRTIRTLAAKDLAALPRS
jgi:hypothetical protein